MEGERGQSIFYDFSKSVGVFPKCCRFLSAGTGVGEAEGEIYNVLLSAVSW